MTAPNGRGADSQPTTCADVTNALTLLFVPGDRPDRYARAAAAAADVIVIDLEDAVAPEMKAEARESARRWFAAGGTGVIRVNAPDTPYFTEDVAALSPHVDAVVLPKAEDPGAVADLLAVLQRVRSDAGVIALIETAKGVLKVAEIAAVPGVVRLAFGNFDLSTELGLDPEDTGALWPLRSSVLVASAAAGLPAPIDGVTGSIDDEESISADARNSRRRGFGAKLCIHPRQVPVVAAGLAPTPDEVAWAGRVMSAWSHASTGAVALDGKMIDKPVIDRARRVLAAAGVRTDSSGSAWR